MILLALVVGCGVTPSHGIGTVTTSQPVAQACATAITGMMKDSLTYKPVAQGIVLLETGAPQPELSPGLDTHIVEFAEVSRAVSDASGGFRLCLPGPVSAPSILVFTAMDGAGKEYAPLVQSAIGVKDLGPVSIGECYISCDISSGMESDLPVVIEGVVTSTPVAKARIVTAQAGIPPLDHTQTAWSVAIPGLGAGEMTAFQTWKMDACAGFCAPYRFTLPTRAPLVQSPADFTSTGPGGPVTPPGTGYTQERGFVGYTVYATASGCKYPFGGAAFQSDGRSYLIATPGAVLHAKDAAFTGCQ